MQKLQKILVTGASGQLGQSLQKLAGKRTSVIFAGKKELDITDTKAVASFFNQHQPQIVINTAAYTQVDAAESNAELAFLMNAETVKKLAETCKIFGCKLMHISTDYVFDGSLKIAYKETDIPNPITIYGKSKLAGERYIEQSALEEFAIVRTSWLYSNFGHNFYKTMLHLAKSKNEISVVDDQQGCPTYALDLAKALLQIAAKLTKENSGVYHYCNTGITTWHGFAKAIFEAKQLLVNIHPIVTSSFPTAAKRPAFSVLDTQKVQKTFHLAIPSWEEGLSKCILEG
ncbi:MAG: dTDP-4-dehydrorhamnose reductase [Bacteroidetes bacterium HGW-Bacteroidetes-2]|jgi:dTDP-4-dehydrorhamnose reductase|nr:MAG: dTDP-4-dehydrorhamnose reductase [Bacteroidetes bacterium HGW-Bacteroidetes-2]